MSVEHKPPCEGWPCTCAWEPYVEPEPGVWPAPRVDLATHHQMLGRAIERERVVAWLLKQPTYLNPQALALGIARGEHDT